MTVCKHPILCKAVASPSRENETALRSVFPPGTLNAQTPHSGGWDASCPARALCAGLDDPRRND